MQPGPDVDAEVAHRFGHGEGAADGPGRSVERGQEPVPGGVHLAAPAPGEEPPDPSVVGGQEPLPSPVAELGRPRGRAYDVGEQHGGEHPIELRLLPQRPEEASDLFDDRVRVTVPRQVVDPFQLDELRARDVARQVPRLLGRNGPAATLG
jgi:hypothetical protein